MARAISKILFILESYNFLAYLECIRSYAWSKGHSEPDLGSVTGLELAIKTAFDAVDTVEDLLSSDDEEDWLELMRDNTPRGMQGRKPPTPPTRGGSEYSPPSSSTCRGITSPNCVGDEYPQKLAQRKGTHLIDHNYWSELEGFPEPELGGKDGVKKGVNKDNTPRDKPEKSGGESKSKSKSKSKSRSKNRAQEIRACQHVTRGRCPRKDKCTYEHFCPPTPKPKPKQKPVSSNSCPAKPTSLGGRPLKLARGLLPLVPLAPMTPMMATSSSLPTKIAGLHVAGILLGQTEHNTPHQQGLTHTLASDHTRGKANNTTPFPRGVCYHHQRPPPK